MSSAAPVTASPKVRNRPSPQPDSRPTSKVGQPKLTVVAPPRPRVAGTGAFTVVILGILAMGMVILLFLNTTLAQGAFQISSLTKTHHALTVSQQQLAQSIAIAESPEHLQARAVALGMVASDSPVFIRIADGKILGTPVPAPRPPRVIAVVPLKATTAIVKTGNGVTTP